MSVHFFGRGRQVATVQLIFPNQTNQVASQFSFAGSTDVHLANARPSRRQEDNNAGGSNMSVPCAEAGTPNGHDDVQRAKVDRTDDERSQSSQSNNDNNNDNNNNKTNDEVGVVARPCVRSSFVHPSSNERTNE